MSLNLAGFHLPSSVLKATFYWVLLILCLPGCGKERTEKGAAGQVYAFKLKYGDRAPIFEAEEVWGDVFDSESAEGKTILMEFFNYEVFHRSPAFWKYSDVLARRYRDKGFLYLLVLNDKRFELSEVKKTLADGDVELPVVLRQSEKLNDLFGLPPGSVAFVLIDSTWVIRFARPTLLSSDTKRQLVEKSVLGKIKYTFNEEDSLRYPFRVGERMPDLNLEQVGSGKKLMLSELCSEPTICFLFAARCSRCEIKKFFKTLATIEQSLQGEAGGENMLVILAHDLGKEELENHLKDSKISIPAYQTADLRNLTSEYVTRKTEADRPKVIFVDRSGTITYLNNLSDFRIELKNNSVDFRSLQRKET